MTMNTPKDIFFRCPNCKVKNRIPPRKLGDIGKCGKCGAPLETAELQKPQPMTVTDRNFDSVVLKSPLPVLLECWSPGCPACQTLAPVVDAFAKDLKGKIRVGRINVAQSSVLSSRYDMRSVPVLLLFDGGRLEDQLIGAVPRDIILQKILRYL